MEVGWLYNYGKASLLITIVLQPLYNMVNRKINGKMKGFLLTKSGSRHTII